MKLNQKQKARLIQLTDHVVVVVMKDKDIKDEQLDSAFEYIIELLKDVQLLTR